MMKILSWEFFNNQLSKPTSIFGLKLWMVIGICIGAFVVVLLFLLSLFITSRCRPGNSTRRLKKLAAATPAAASTTAAVAPSVDDSTPAVSKEIQEVVVVTQQEDNNNNNNNNASADPPLPPGGSSEIRIDIGKPNHRVVVFGDYLKQKSHQLKPDPLAGVSGESCWSGADSASVGGGRLAEVSHLGWGHWYTLKELEEATGGLAPENVIGEGGFGIVYRGVLADKTTVAIKNLLNNRGQAEKEFKVEVEAIGRVRHKNLVRLLGYCVEGEYRMLVYEYADNGNLDQWLHGEKGKSSPVTWETRMKIILGTAKGLGYLHEGIEPKVVHRDVKSSNILLNKKWIPKVSDFGLAKLLCSDTNHIATRVMGTLGYVAPEYASTGMLNERSDMYSFGILVMEIITGRVPVDYNRPTAEVYLVEWLKSMVGERKCEQVLDPNIPDKPSSRALKRALLVALRCVDPDASKRPKMGNVIHMLEMDELLLGDDRKLAREEPGSRRDCSKRTFGRFSYLYDGETSFNRDQSKV